MNDEDRTFPADAVAFITAMVVAILAVYLLGERQPEPETWTPATAAEPTPTKIEAPRVIP